MKQDVSQIEQVFSHNAVPQIAVEIHCWKRNNNEFDHISLRTRNCTGMSPAEEGIYVSIYPDTSVKKHVIKTWFSNTPAISRNFYFDRDYYKDAFAKQKIITGSYHEVITLYISQEQVEVMEAYFKKLVYSDDIPRGDSLRCFARLNNHQIRFSFWASFPYPRYSFRTYPKNYNCCIAVYDLLKIIKSKEMLETVDQPDNKKWVMGALIGSVGAGIIATVGFWLLQNWIRHACSAAATRRFFPHFKKRLGNIADRWLATRPAESTVNHKQFLEVCSSAQQDSNKRWWQLSGLFGVFTCVVSAVSIWTSGDAATLVKTPNDMVRMLRKIESQESDLQLTGRSSNA